MNGDKHEYMSVLDAIYDVTLPASTIWHAGSLPVKSESGLALSFIPAQFLCILRFHSAMLGIHDMVKSRQESFSCSQLLTPA